MSGLCMVHDYVEFVSVEITNNDMRSEIGSPNSNFAQFTEKINDIFGITYDLCTTLII